MDPILEYDLKKRRVNRMQQYNAHLKHMAESEQEGNFQGKKVKKIPAENSPIKFKYPN